MPYSFRNDLYNDPMELKPADQTSITIEEMQTAAIITAGHSSVFPFSSPFIFRLSRPHQAKFPVLLPIIDNRRLYVTNGHEKPFMVLNSSTLII
uniref:Uncharacterized protein n=1 Tax=Romanomermis culicivorax TaxID=13658 RepID=A0A915HJV1_ROMCU